MTDASGAPAGGRLIGGRYRLERVLKQGHGIDTVLARDTTDGRRVVVKSTPASTVSSALYMRLEHEAAVLSRVRSPSFVPLLEVGMDDDLLYLVTPYQDGLTLAEVLQGEPLDVRDALTIARGVLGALQVVHDHGVLHRDVKPANIIVDAAGSIRRTTLIDFGFARSTHLDPSIRDVPVGTVSYISPEQAGLLDADVDERSDLYSLGVVLFESLAGRLPFEGDSAGEILQQHMTTQPPELRSLGVKVPRALDEVIQRLLRKDPRDRYQSAEAARFDIDAIAHGIERGDTEPTIVVGSQDRRTTLTEPSFVGRRRELVALGAVLSRARAGRGGLVLLESESGGGKTRLLEEFGQLGAQKSTWVLGGQGLDQAAQRPYQLLVGVASAILAAKTSGSSRVAAVRERLGPETDAVCDAFPELTDALGPRTAEALGPDVHGEARTLRALSLLLDSLGSAEEPALVMLDDCQWADEPTLKLLAHWAAKRGSDASRHVALVAAFRSEEVTDDHPLRAMTVEARMTLSPLEAADVGALVESMAGTLPSEAIAIVERLAEGSPFMASAVLRGLVESGALVHDATGWVIERDALADAQSSRRAATFLTKRIELLPEPSLHLLSVGAVLGKEFDIDLAVSLAGFDAELAIASLDEARRRHIVWAKPDSPKASFVHDKLRETLLARLPDDERLRLHELAARRLEDAHPDRVFEISYHFDAAGDPARALPYAMQAAGFALKRHSLELAEQQYRIADRGATTDGGNEVRRQIAEGLGHVLMLRGVYAEAKEQLDRAAGFAEDDLTRATIETELSELAFKRGDLDASGAYGEGALRRLGQRVPRTSIGYLLAALWEIIVQVAHTAVPRAFVGRRAIDAARTDLMAARVYSRLAHVYWFKRGSIPTLWTHLREMNLAERYPPTPELAQAYSEHAPVMALVPLFARGIRYAQRSLQIRTDLGDVWGQGQSLNFYGVVLYNAGRYREAIERCGHASRLLERTGDRWEHNIARVHSALSRYRLGELSSAVDEARSVHASGVEIGDPQASGIGVEAWSKASGGRLPGPVVRTELERESEDVQLIAEVMQAHAVRLLARGRPGEAVDVLDDARERVRKAGMMQEYVAPIWPWLATALREEAESISQIDPRRRQKLLRRARRVARSARRHAIRFPNSRPHVFRELGLLAAMRGRAHKARRYLDQSLLVAERQEARWEHAQTLLARGRIGLVYGWPGAAEDEQNGRHKVRDLTVELEHADEEPESETTLSLVDRFATLLDTGRRIASALTASEIYHEVRSGATQLLRAERCAVLEVDASGQVRATGGDEPYSATLVARTLQSGRPVVHTEGITDDSSESIELGSIRSAMCAPIFVRGHVDAVLYVSHRQVAGLFGEDEERMASFIAAIAGAALENAEGFEEVQALTRTLERRVDERTLELQRANTALDTSLKRLQQAYDRERDVVRRLRELDELKSDFLSTVSHELRTPLTAIEGFAQTLIQRWIDVDETRRVDFINRIATNAASLNTMIAELLDFARLERGQAEVRREPCDLAYSVRKVVDRLETVLARHHVEIDVPDDVSVLADPNSCDRIFANLLTNAAKFSDPGSRIVVRGRDDGEHVVLSVSDEGVGIPPDELDRIFERFYRVQRGDHSGRGGTGIGLAIVKEYVEALGGRVDVQSTLGEGSTFTLTIRRSPRADLEIRTPRDTASA